jgi:hypothetical protein
MARSKLLLSLFVLVGICTLAVTSFAAPKKCAFNGDYSFYFWVPNEGISGVGYFGVKLNPKLKCRSGVVLPGGIIECNFSEGELYQDFIEEGAVFLEEDGEGTMEIETNSSNGICGTGKNALELDISVVKGGKSVLFNSNGVEKARSGMIPQAGYDYALTGRADKCFPGQISGCYDLRFWTPDEGAVGDCTVCVDGQGGVTGGQCRCNVNDGNGGFEYLSSIFGGAYTLGLGCQSATGFMWFTTTSDLICGVESSVAISFVVANGGTEILGACDPDQFILNNTSLFNAGFFAACSIEGYLQ